MLDDRRLNPYGQRNLADASRSASQFISCHGHAPMHQVFNRSNAQHVFQLIHLCMFIVNPAEVGYAVSPRAQIPKNVLVSCGEMKSASVFDD